MTTKTLPREEECWRHFSSAPQPQSCLLGRLHSAAGLSSPSPKQLFVHLSHHPSPNTGPEAASSWGPPQAGSHESHPSWTAAFAWGKSSEGTRRVACFSSHTTDGSGGSPCLLQPLCLWLLQGNQGCDLNEAWNSASPGEVTLSESCVFILFSLKKNQSPEKDKFWPVVICFGSD